MSALALGLVAAFAWGFHDVCVRRLSQHRPLMASLLVVLVAGTVFHAVAMAGTQTVRLPEGRAVWLGVAAGVFYLVASLGLYGAFQRGPVRLVAPIIASYPVLSVAWAVFQGTPVSFFAWLAVLGIILGVSIVAALSGDHADDIPPRGPTILLALVAAFGFAGTFALGQMAAAAAGHMPATLLARLVAIVLLGAIMGALRLPVWPGLRAMPVLCLMGAADGLALMCVLAAADLPDAAYAAVAASVFGLLTILMARVFLGERMSLPQWAGCGLAFTGIGYLAL